MKEFGFTDSLTVYVSAIRPYFNGAMPKSVGKHSITLKDGRECSIKISQSFDVHSISRTTYQWRVN